MRGLDGDWAHHDVRVTVMLTRDLGWANGHTKCGWYLLRLFAHCGLDWNKARLGAPGLGGFEKSGFFEHPAGDPALSTYLLPVDLAAKKTEFSRRLLEALSSFPASKLGPRGFVSERVRQFEVGRG